MTNELYYLMSFFVIVSIALSFKFQVWKKFSTSKSTSSSGSGIKISWMRISVVLFVWGIGNLTLSLMMPKVWDWWLGFGQRFFLGTQLAVVSILTILIIFGKEQENAPGVKITFRIIFLILFVAFSYHGCNSLVKKTSKKVGGEKTEKIIYLNLDEDWIVKPFQLEYYFDGTSIQKSILGKLQVPRTAVNIIVKMINPESFVKFGIHGSDGDKHDWRVGGFAEFRVFPPRKQRIVFFESPFSKKTFPIGNQDENTYYKVRSEEDRDFPVVFFDLKRR